MTGPFLKNMMTNILSVPAHVWQKCGELLHYPLSWLTAIGLFIIDIFAGHAFLIMMVVVVTIMDAGWGIAVSVKRNKFTLSELLRLTIVKIAVYGCALWMFLALDTFIESETGLTVDITSGLIGVLIVLTEGWSSAASALILFPNVPFLRVMQKALTGEIARKLGISEEEVTAMMKKKRGAKAQPRSANGQFAKKP